MPDFDFPLLDGPRDEADAHGRVVVTECRFIEPFIHESDGWCTLPIRVTHAPDSGLVLELGPYELGRRDVAKLRDALRAYDFADNGPSIRRVQ
jgi:hypothetical protein